MSAQLVPFGRIVRSMRNGLSPSSDGNHHGTVLTLSAVTQGCFNAAHRKEATFGQEPRTDQLVRANMFLVCRGNGNIELVGSGVAVPEDVDTTLVFPDTVIGAELDSDQIDLRYLSHVWATRPIRAQIEAGARTTNGTYKVNQQVLEAIEVPLPSISDQRRVARILDKADAIRRKRQEAIALTEQLIRSTFLEMLGDPITNPKRWPLVELRGHVVGMDAGWSANGEPRARQEDEWGVLKVSAVSSGWFRPDEHKAVSSSAITDASSLIVPKRGDLLFSRANTRELVAATCLVESDETRVFLPDKLWRIRTNAKSLSAEYLKFVLSDPKVQAEIAKVATGTSGSMLNVSKEKVGDLKIPLPPLVHQIAFAKIVWRSFALRAQGVATALQADNLFNSLVQRAFSGQL